MQDIWTKLNLKDQQEIVILNAPESFEPSLNLLAKTALVRRGISDENFDFLLAFVLKREEIDQITRDLVAVSDGDVVVWFAYPKGTSKNFTCDFNRDNGWDALFEAGFKGVRQIAIDEDWSALRFRRKIYVKSTKK